MNSWKILTGGKNVIQSYICVQCPDHTAQLFIKMLCGNSDMICTHNHVELKIYGVMRHLFFNFEEVATVRALFTGVTEGPASAGFFFLGDFFFGVLFFTGDFFFLGDFCLLGLFVSVRKQMQCRSRYC